jgi:hypothetical protein
MCRYARGSVLLTAASSCYAWQMRAGCEDHPFTHPFHLFLINLAWKLYHWNQDLWEVEHLDAGRFDMGGRLF